MRVESLEVLVAISSITTLRDSIAPIGVLLKTVFESILEVFLLCLAGYILARQGILDKKTQRQLNRLNVSLFTPSLLFSKVAFFLSPAKLRELWILPIFFGLVTVVSMVIAFILSRLFGLKKSQMSFAMAAAMFMNSNSLPIAIMQSLVVTVPILTWGDSDNTESMLGRALTYLIVYSTLGMMVRWSYGVHLLSQADPVTEDAEHIHENDEVYDTQLEDESSPLLSGESSGSAQSLLYKNEYAASSPFENTGINAEPRGTDTLTDASVRHGDERHASGGNADIGQVFFSFPNTPTRSLPRLPQISPPSTRYSLDGDVEDPDGNLELPSPAIGDLRRHLGPEPASARFQSVLRRFKIRVKRVLLTINAFMTIPLWAAVASIIVALIQPLQHVLNSHVRWIKGSLTAAGDCSIPLTLVVLGAYFYTPSENLTSMTRGKNVDGESGTTAKRRPGLTRARGYGSFMSSRQSTLGGDSGTNRSAPKPGETRAVVIAVTSRMFLTPLILFPLMWQVAKTGIFPIFDDPIFLMSNVLFISSPPALTLAQITQAACGDAFERLLSRTIFWSYCVVTPPATIIYILLGLILVRL